MFRKVAPIATLVFLVILAIVYFWGCHRTAPRKPNIIPPGDYRYVMDYTESRVRQLIRRHHLPSVAVSLIDDQDIIWQETFGFSDMEKKIPAKSDTVYKLWSVSKIFTAIETMRLVEEGQVDLDAPITDYIPGFSIQSRFPDSKPITIRSLLAHHSGLPRNACHKVTPKSGNENALGEMAMSMKDGYTAFPVGSRYKYSNLGPDILGHVIQELRGKIFARYMKENMLDSIEMKNSAFLSAYLSPQMNIALGYEYYKGKYIPYKQVDIGSLPSGNLYSTIEDMSAFVKFIFRGGEAGGKQIIKPETLKQMFENQYSSKRDPQPMGLGWKIIRAFGSEPMVWHDGGPSEGIGALVAFLPEKKLGIVLLANSTSFESNVSVLLAVEILKLMLETRYGIMSPEDKIPEKIKIDRSLLDDYAGKYIAFGKVMDVSSRKDQLKGKIDGMKLDLIPVDQNKFRVSHWIMNLGLQGLFNLPIDLRKLEIEFSNGDEGGEDLMIINIGNISYEICPRYPDFKDIPPLWKDLAGEYELVARLPSGSMGIDILGYAKIRVENGVLQMDGTVGPILPISETEIIIESGPFAGETMVYDSGTGNIYHQFFVYKPKKSGLNTKN